MGKAACFSYCNEIENMPENLERERDEYLSFQKVLLIFSSFIFFVERSWVYLLYIQL